MKPIITVIIPTYDRKHIVKEAIDSVLQQEPNNFEVIIVDDGSNDGTKEYLESLNLPIKIIRQENGGISSARNTGIKNAQGEYIAFLDSDDLWLPGILKAQLQYLESHPEIPLVYTDQYMELFGKRDGKTRFTAQPLNHEQKLHFNFPGFITPQAPIHISSVMVRKSILDEVGLFSEDLKVHEDSEMWNRISENHGFGYIDTPLAIFRWEKDPEHMLKPGYRDFFINDGRKYVKMYENRRKDRGLTEEEKSAIEESYSRIEKLEKLIQLQDTGEITEDEFQKRKSEIF